jgi:hypothetical protein
MSKEQGQILDHSILGYLEMANTHTHILKGLI